MARDAAAGVTGVGISATMAFGLAAMSCAGTKSLRCDAARGAGDHLVYIWTFTGTHAATGNAVSVTGWEEWDLDASGLITLSRGWFDAEDYARQTAPK